ncbi:hypothetical protein KAI37_00211 [Paenibacillus sp. S25]|jgi:hypothetical protein|nr:hypothetical protein KAI37_00211 [Paenibacillus sp. S25]
MIYSHLRIIERSKLEAPSLVRGQFACDRPRTGKTSCYHQPGNFPERQEKPYEAESAQQVYEHQGEMDEGTGYTD